MSRAFWALLLALATTPAIAGDLRVSGARASAPLPGTSVMAGYLELRNAGGEAVVVRGAESRTFDRLSLHRTVESDGQTRMEPVEALTIEPGERVALEPGGLHLMMFEPEPRPSAGDRVRLRLLTSAGPLGVDMRVVERAELLDH